MSEQTLKSNINLLKAELLPAKPLVTLNRVVIFWLALALLMFTWAEYSSMRSLQLSKQVSALTSEKKVKTQRLAEYESLIKARKTDPALEAKLATLNVVMRNKRALHARLTDPEHMDVSGFADPMTELSKYHHKDISLQQVNIIQNQLTFSGLAKTANAVPKWLSGFEQSDLLSGKQFSHFQLSQDENNYTVFTVGSRDKAPLNKEQQ